MSGKIRKSLQLFRKVFCLNWWSLRGVGSLWVLKVSYVALVAIPFLTKVVVRPVVRDFVGLTNWFLPALFFGSLFLAIANLVYDIFCPSVVKRFGSQNDLYARMLEIRELSSRLYPHDNFDATLDHCKKKYESDSFSRPFWRCVCSTSYVAAGVLLALVFAHRAQVVIDAWWHSPQ